MIKQQRLKKIINKKIIISLIILLIIVVGLGFFVFKKFYNNNSDINTAPSKIEASLNAVQVHPTTVTIYQELPARTSAYKIAEIRPQVSGIITERLFKEGDYVKEGMQLYQIDPAPYKATYNMALADLQKAKANLKVAQAKYNRYEELIKFDAVTTEQLEDVEASLSQASADISIANATVAKAKINLDYTKVYAPISGWIGKSQVTKGALVVAEQDDSIATITALDPIYVDISQSSKELMVLRTTLGNYDKIPVELFVGDDNNKYPHEGILQFHEVTIDQTTDTVRLRALFSNPDNALLPGLFVRVKIRLDIPNAILIPQSATIRGPDGSLTVWKVNGDGSIEQAIITTRGTQDDNWIVESGLNKGDVVVTEGLIQLNQSTMVKPIIKE